MKSKCLILLLVACGLMLSGCEQKARTPTGYDTTVKFVNDGDYFDKEEFEKMMAEGWEVMSSRRAWESINGVQQEWGTEYTLRKPLYR